MSDYSPFYLGGLRAIKTGWRFEERGRRQKHSSSSLSPDDTLNFEAQPFEQIDCFLLSLLLWMGHRRRLSGDHDGRLWDLVVLPGLLREYLQ